MRSLFVCVLLLCALCLFACVVVRCFLRDAMCLVGACFFFYVLLCVLCLADV